MTDLQLLPFMSMNFEGGVTSRGHRTVGQAPGFAIAPSLSQAIDSYYGEAISSFCPLCSGHYNFEVGSHTCLEQLFMHDPTGRTVFNVESSRTAISGTFPSQNIYTGHLLVGELAAMPGRQEEPVSTGAASYETQDTLRSYPHVPQIGTPEILSPHRYGVQKTPTTAVPESKVATLDDLHKRQV
jgi:hypothetical protein